VLFREDVDTGLRGVTCSDIEHMEREVLKVFSRDRLILPAAVKGVVKGTTQSTANPSTAITTPSTQQPPFATIQDALETAAKLESDFNRDFTKSADSSMPSAAFSSNVTYPSPPFGWPRLQDSLGKVALVWLDGQNTLMDALNCRNKDGSMPNDRKSGSSSSSNNQAGSDWFHDDERILFFASSRSDKPYVSIYAHRWFEPSTASRIGGSLSNSDAGAASHAATMLSIAHSRGLLIRATTVSQSTYEPHPNPARFHAALDVGAHDISTDFEECVEREKDEDHPPTDALVIEEASRLQPVQTKGTTQDETAATPSPTSPIPIQPFLPPSYSLSTPASNLTSSDIYCERLPSMWPFECNTVRAPFFCEAALTALRMQYDFAEYDRRHMHGGQN